MGIDFITNSFIYSSTNLSVNFSIHKMTFKKGVVIDCKGLLLGRLASIIAKQLLKGQRIVAVRCEELNISGSHYRNPSKILWRVTRGMMKHKTTLCQKALHRLRVFEGVPSQYEKKKKLVCPSASRVLRLKPCRDFCRLGDLCTRVGWGHDDLIQKLEKKRKIRAQINFNKKK